ncbi:MAG: magnesium transporter, partial [Clostridiales bacterium]|nr:magnesium transporter [Clostridiales bacterium]
MTETTNFEFLLSLLNDRKFAELKENLVEMNEVDIAAFICETEDEENRLIIFRMLPKDISADVFSNLP